MRDVKSAIQDSILNTHTILSIGAILTASETIARQGRELALEKHTYERRVDDIVEIMEKLTGLDN